MENLKKLYSEHVSESEFNYNLGEMPEVIDAQKKLIEALAPKMGGAWNIVDIENEIAAVACANEMQGWVHGFMYAVRLFMACGVKGGTTI